METYVLRNGQVIPAIGVGTGLIKHRAKNSIHYLFLLLKEKTKNVLIKDFKRNNRYPITRDRKKDKMVPVVLDEYIRNCDYPFVDTARAYMYSEKELGGILYRNSKKDVFIVSKMTNWHQRNNRYQECIDESLKNVGIDCFDLYLLHWPQTDTYIDAYRELLKARNDGKTKGVGVANFNIEHIEMIKKYGLELPLINEFECHPYLQQKELVEYCKENDIQVVAYAPTGHKLREFSNLPIVKDMCIKHNVNPSQIIMRWHYQNGIIPIFNTTDIGHLRDNLNIFDFELSQKEMSYISTLDAGERYWPDPANCDFSQL